MTTLAALRAVGFTLKMNGDRLLVEPRERITDDLRAFIREHKPQIMEELAGVERRTGFICCHDCQHYDGAGRCGRFGFATAGAPATCVAFSRQGEPVRELPPTPARQAMERGTAVRCQDCMHFEPRPGDRLGDCYAFGVAAFADTLFECEGFAGAEPS